MDNKRDIPLCEVCQQPANQTCGGCKLVYYCSKAHQKLGWREGHKFKCCAFKIQYSDTLGRHMVATRDIKPGEMILKEKPAVLGPRISNPPQCLSCGVKLEPYKTGDVIDFYKCSSCNWPMCSQKCEKAEIHKAECKIMTDRKYKCTITYDKANPNKSEAAYCVIAPLRVLLMKDNNPMQYENIMNLQSHLDDRINTPMYRTLKANLVTFIIQVLGLPFDEETIMKIAAIMDTNAFDVRSPDSLKRLRAIYVTAAMMDHSCRPNTRHIILGDDYNIAFIATVPIAKGSFITGSYTQTLWGTLDRRRHLKTTKCFDCECDRCKDPTEFGTYLGSIYCSICNGLGALTGNMLVSTNPLDEKAIWKCQKCEHYIQSKQMFWGNNALKQDLSRMDKKNPKQFEEFIEKYSQTLHPSNHLVVQAKLALIQIYGNYKGYSLTELSDDLLKRKVDLCHEMLELAEKLEPGYSRFRGTLLLDLQAAMTIQTKREFDAEKFTKEGAQDQLMQSMTLLQEATKILKVEPHMRDTLEARIKELADQLETNAEGSDTLSVD